MTTYNIVSPTLLAPGQPEDISVVLANFQAIQTILNGGVDSTNLADAAVTSAKLADGAATAVKGGFAALQNPAVSSTSITYSSIPSWVRQVKIFYRLLTTSAIETSLLLRFNGDAANNYQYSTLELLNGSLNTGTTSANNYLVAGVVGTSATSYASGEITIPEFSASGSYGHDIFALYTCNAINRRIGITGGRWIATAAITSITLLSAGGNFSGSAMLYGAR